MEIGARGSVILAALGFDLFVLLIFTISKLNTDPVIVICAVVAILSVFAFERHYLSAWLAPQKLRAEIEDESSAIEPHR